MAVKILGIVSFVLFAVNCSTTEPPPAGEAIMLTLEDVSSTEAWIKLTTSNLQLPASLTLKQNESIREAINLTMADTLLYIDSLLPNTNYTFKAGRQEVRSQKLEVKTLDTTSHNFTWQSWTFGEHSSSLLYDVAIIDENNIWAVGEIYMNDSLGQPDLHAYNAIHWNGTSWKLIRIYFQTICGQINLSSYPAKAVFAFGDEIWISSAGDKIAKVNNGIQFFHECIPWSFSIKSIWGINSSDLYIAGNNGNIARYYGGWIKLASGTTTIINDIWGTQINNTNNLILCSVSNIASPGDRKILQINDNVVNDFLWDTGRRVQSIWFNGANAIYACGGGVFSLKDGVHWQEITEIPLYYTQKIRGVENNDIMVVGDFGLMAHYNGSTWKVSSGPAADIYYSCAVSKNLVVAVGMKGSKGFISLANN